ncbi:MAG: hypothetical protein HY909_05700 [Deltaproteobacteria bacterium]|nr:hypothetical protein [Deltaproteobacteria bacterium]
MSPRLSAVALALLGCASPPDQGACEGIQTIPCGDGYLDPSGAWVTSTWTGPRIRYPAYTTVRLCHGLGRIPTSVELWASFSPDGLLAMQVGNVASVLPTCDGMQGVTTNSVLLRNGGGQEFYIRVVLR